MFRNPLICLAGASIALTPMHAFAQEPEAQLSVDEIVCRYSNDCAAADDAAAEDDGDPPTRGFSFQPARKPTVAPKPTVTPKPTAVSAPTRPKTVARVKPKPTITVSENDLLISFANNSADLTAQARANAAVFAQALQTDALKDKRFMIAGHTNATGSREHNIDLSRRRALAVADFLESKGVDRLRLRLRGFGFDEPLPGRDPTAPANRRVEASVIEN
jgi:outer membrane protein OmpA-like peptidoglycan-associated protein